MIDLDFLKQLTEIPSVGTACGPVLNLIASRFGDHYSHVDASDGFRLFHKRGAVVSEITTLFVAHVDEIGGCIYGPRPGGGFNARYWGNRPAVFAYAELQGFDYLAQDGHAAFPVHGTILTVEGPAQVQMPGHSARAHEIVSYGEEKRLVLHGDGIKPYRTVWTFKQSTTFIEDTIDGKALDPRVTVYSVMEAVRALDGHSRCRSGSRCRAPSLDGPSGPGGKEEPCVPNRTCACRTARVGKIPTGPRMPRRLTNPPR